MNVKYGDMRVNYAKNPEEKILIIDFYDDTAFNTGRIMTVVSYEDNTDLILTNRLGMFVVDPSLATRKSMWGSLWLREIAKKSDISVDLLERIAEFERNLKLENSDIIVGHV